MHYKRGSTEAMYLEIRFTCKVANSGYAFDDEGWIKPVNPLRGYFEKPLNEIAVFELIDLFEFLDESYQSGLPSRAEQTEIIRFYNRWGFLEWYSKEREMAPWLIRSIKETWDTVAATPISMQLVQDQTDLSEVYGNIELLRHALGIAKVRANKTKFTSCEYLKIYGHPRDRKKGSCPPRCRIKRNGKKSWGKGCQQVHDNHKRRGKLNNN